MKRTFVVTREGPYRTFTGLVEQKGHIGSRKAPDGQSQVSCSTVGAIRSSAATWDTTQKEAFRETLQAVS